MYGSCQPQQGSRRAGVVADPSPGLRLALVLPLLAGLLTEAAAQPSNSVFERIRQSLPRRELGWRLTEADEPYQQRNRPTQASFVWTGGDGEVRATVVWHRSLKAAREQFKRSPKGERAMESFRVEGIGDEGYLFPPVVLNQAGPYNLRFRKEQVEVSMSAESKATLERCAKYIVEALAGTEAWVPTEATAPRR